MTRCSAKIDGVSCPLEASVLVLLWQDDGHDDGDPVTEQATCDPHTLTLLRSRMGPAGVMAHMEALDGPGPADQTALLLRQVMDMGRQVAGMRLAIQTAASGLRTGKIRDAVEALASVPPPADAQSNRGQNIRTFANKAPTGDDRRVADRRDPTNPSVGGRRVSDRRRQP